MRRRSEWRKEKKGEEEEQNQDGARFEEEQGSISFFLNEYSLCLRVLLDP